MRVLAPLFVALLLAVPATAGVPFDIDDPTPRPIRVELDEEVNDFGVQGGAYGVPLIGSFSSDGSVATVTLPGPTIESRIALLFEGLLDPQPGSFSDYVIRIDVATREVLSADATGVLDAGPAGVLSITQTASSTETAGFFLALFQGFDFPFYCIAGVDCVLVPGAAYDPATGRARAVGRVATGLLDFFSPFGDIRLTEAMPLACDTAVAAQDVLPGEPVLVELVIRNDGPVERPIEIKVYARDPNGQDVSFVNVGYEGSSILQPGDVFAFPRTTVFALPPLAPPLGTFEVGCRLLNPVTGETLVEDQDFFEAKSAP